MLTNVDKFMFVFLSKINVYCLGNNPIILNFKPINYLILYFLITIEEDKMSQKIEEKRGSNTVLYDLLSQIPSFTNSISRYF